MTVYVDLIRLSCYSSLLHAKVLITDHSQDDKIYDESYKAQPEELSESLAEAEEVGTLLTQQIYNKWRASCRTLFGS